MQFHLQHSWMSGMNGPVRLDTSHLNLKVNYEQYDAWQDWTGRLGRGNNVLLQFDRLVALLQGASQHRSHKTCPVLRVQYVQPNGSYKRHI